MSKRCYGVSLCGNTHRALLHTCGLGSQRGRRFFKKALYEVMDSKIFLYSFERDLGVGKWGHTWSYSLKVTGGKVWGQRGTIFSGQMVEVGIRKVK